MEKMLDKRKMESLNEIARYENLTRAKVTQIMNLLKLPADIQEFLLELADAKEIKKYSERKIRRVQPDSLARLRATQACLVYNSERKWYRRGKSQSKAWILL